MQSILLRSDNILIYVNRLLTGFNRPTIICSEVIWGYAMPQISVYADEERKRKVDKLAEMLGTNRSKLVQKALDRYIDEFGEFLEEVEEE